MAMAERHLAAVFGEDVVDHKTYVLASDGDLMEGISQEAIALAGHLKLNKLIVLFDDNGISIDGALSLSDSTDQVKRFEASGWAAMRVDGHDHEGDRCALCKRRKSSDRPTLIACKTTIGFGAPTKAGKSSSHGSPLGAEEIKGARAGARLDFSRLSRCPPIFWPTGARPANARSLRMPNGTSASPRSMPASAPNSNAG